MKRLSRFLLTMCVLAGLNLSLSGCVVIAPFIDGFKKMGATPADRRGLFNQSIKAFGDSLYWAKGETGMFVHPDADPKLRKKLNEVNEDIRIIETKVKNLEFDDGSHEANLDVIVKYYKVGHNIVTERKEHQVWKFSMSSGWQLFSLETSKG